MKKIIFINLSLAAGGAERVIVNLANYLSNQYEVEICTILDKGIAYSVNENVSVKQFGNRNDSIFKRILNSFKLKKYLKENKPDSIISFCPTMCFIMCFFKFLYPFMKNIKLIISERNDPNNEYKNFIVKKAANFLYSKSDKIVFQTNDAKCFFNKKCQEKGIVIPNPLNDKFINFISENKKENTIISVGRLAPQKNQRLLIDAFNNVKDIIPNYTLLIYGTGELEKELNDRINELGCQKRIKLMGNSNKIEKELDKGKIFVLSSDFEGMPNALMEAMAVGLACISTDCPCGGPEMLIRNNENGVLIETKNQKQLEESLVNVATNEEFMKKIADNAKNIKNEFSSEKIYKKWIEII